MALKFDKSFDPAYGRSVEVAPGVSRITAENPSAFTFHGTNSYLVGRTRLALIDPGPDSDAHLATLMRAIDGRALTDVFVSHTHVDHSPLTRRLVELTGARVHAHGPHIAARAMRLGETNPLDASADLDFAPDVTLVDGDVVEGDGWALRAIFTPGHTANHMAFALDDQQLLFSADHVMAWATSIVAPPDGSMSDYMRSLDRLLEEEFGQFLPGHGGPVSAPAPFMRGLKAHRKMRERAIVERLQRGDRQIHEMVRAIYRDTDPRLHGAAALSLLAHLEDLVDRGIVRAEDQPSLDGVFLLV